MSFISFLLENEDSYKRNFTPVDIKRAQRVADDIRELILNDEYAAPEEGKYPTDTWIAAIARESEGKLNRSLLDYMTEVRRLNSEDPTDDYTGSYLNPEQHPDYTDERMALGRRIYIAYDYLRKRGFLAKGSSDFFSPFVALKGNSPQAKQKRDAFSKIKQVLSSGVIDAKRQGDTDTDTREAVSAANREWADSLTGSDKEYLKAYTEMSPKAISLAIGIARVQAQKSWQAASDAVRQLIDKESAEINELIQNGFVKSNGTINLERVRGFLGFIASPPKTAENVVAYRLGQFNREVDYINKRAEARRALAANVVDRKLGSDSPTPNMAAIKNTLEDMTPAEISAATKLAKREELSPAETQSLKSLGIVDAGGEVTPFGNAVIKVARHEPDAYNLSDRPSDYSRADDAEKKRRLLQRGQNRNIRHARKFSDYRDSLKK